MGTKQSRSASHQPPPPSSTLTTSSKSRLTQWQLPTDLIERIALFVPDSLSFFAFLDAINTADGVLGDLAHFLALRHYIHADVLWPHSARLTYPVVPSSHVWPRHGGEPTRTAVTLASLSAVATYHSIVELPEGLVDMTRFQSKLPATTTLLLETSARHQRLHEAIGTWSNKHACASYAIPRGIDGPPSLAHLDALYMGLCTPTSRTAHTDLVAFLETSHVTKFSLVSTLVFTSAMLSHVVRWLETCPVVSFHFGRSGFLAPLDVVPAFYKALAECATLVDLTLHEVKLPTGFAFAGQVARVARCNVASVGPFLAGMPHVHTLSLELPPKSIAWGDHAHRFVLPLLVHLEIHHLLPAAVQRLCQALCDSTVESLTLVNNDKDFSTIESSLCMHWLAQYVPRWPRLERLHLSHYCMHATETETHAFGHGLRQAKRLRSLRIDETKAVRISDLAPHVANMPHLHELAIHAGALKSVSSWAATGNPFSQLFANRTLHAVAIVVSETNDSVVQRLAEALVGNRTIRELSCRVAAKDVKMVVDVLGARSIPTMKLQLQVKHAGPDFKAKVRALAKSQPQEIYLIQVIELLR
ncbi:Aste57867_10052 [Aphanomyces stellatus]|uniref:Aste57867_10052 protein n=1 Tax=Aphanomyces stellatus TaxID=120398 RepID=A0A485KPD6_9STRA|nr:hypothetical protein As57867_010013 [Aphanomyces stellatus]VFT86928.1 Aste57867_10052 [Aphanomyces stellatus]